MQTVMRLHIKEAPPPLRERNPKIRQKVADLVMSALAKDPAARPASAAAFASALRANSEGAGTLLRRALVIYSEHLPTFLRTAVVVLSPVIALNLLQLGNKVAQRAGLMPETLGAIVTALIGLLGFIFLLLTTSIISGLTTQQVTQLLITPLRPIRFRPAINRLKKRLRHFVFTTLVVDVLFVFGLALCVVPGVLMMMNYALVPAVVIMEGKSGRAAMRRSKELTRRARRTVAAIILIQFIVPAFLNGLISFFVSTTLAAFKIEAKGMQTIIQEVLFTPFLIFLMSLGAIITALLYVKTRQAGGETLKEALSGFAEEEDDTPRSQWQARIRERVSMASNRNE